MKKGEEIFEDYQKERDYSGSAIDTYAQDLMTYLFHAGANRQEAIFFKLLEKAERENKQISYQERDPNILLDDYPVEGFILIDKACPDFLSGESKNKTKKDTVKSV